MKVKQTCRMSRSPRRFRSFSPNVQPECYSVSELLELRKFRRARQGIDASKLTKGDGKKKRRRKPEDGENMPAGGLQPGVPVSDDSESEYVFFPPYHRVFSSRLVSEPEDKAAKMRRAVRANNFTQQTNALDVDKHMYVLPLPPPSLGQGLTSRIGWCTLKKI
jgi:hypothetical protein